MKYLQNCCVYGEAIDGYKAKAYGCEMDEAYYDLFEELEDHGGIACCSPVTNEDYVGGELRSNL